MSVKPSPLLSIVSSALATGPARCCGSPTCGRSRLLLRRSGFVSSCVWMSRCRSSIMSTSFFQTFFMKAMARSSSASLGASRGVFSEVSGCGRRHRPRFGGHAARQVEALRQHRLLERGVLALQPRDLAFERQPLVGHRLAGPAGGARAALRDLAGAAIEPHEALADAVEGVAAVLGAGGGVCACVLSLVLGRSACGMSRATRPASRTARIGRASFVSVTAERISLTAIAAARRRLNPDTARAGNALHTRAVPRMPLTPS